MVTRLFLGCLLLRALAVTPAAADVTAPGWRLDLSGGAVKQFDASIDSGGDFDMDRQFLRLSATRNIGKAWNAGVSLGYAENRYAFTGSAGFGGLDPWGKIRQLRLGVPVRYRADSQWSFVGIPSLRYSAESGARSSDGRQWGLLAAAAYRFSDRLTLGPGFGVFSEIEESTSFFPILFIDWKITDSLSLTTGRGLAASRGPGIALEWSPAGRWSLSLGARYEKTRFRLDDTGTFPSAVGQDRSIPLALSARYAPSLDIELGLLGGMAFAGNLRLEDASGRLLGESDYAAAPFAGAFVRLRF